jgi:hypothetical protein
LISLPEERKGTSLKTNSQKNLEKIEEMLLEINLRKAARETTHVVPEASSSNISSNINNACVINHDQGKNVLNVFKHLDSESEKSEESDSSIPNSSTDEEIKILDIFFGKTDVSPTLQRIFKTKPVNLTKNWYNKPTPLELQFEERVSKTNFMFLLINYMSEILMVYLNRKSLIG